MENLDTPGFMKLPNGKGVLFVLKNSAGKNYIDCSKYFSRISNVVISPNILNPVHTNTPTGTVKPAIPFFQKIVGTDVLLWALEFNIDGTTNCKFFSSKSEENTTSCQAIIYGVCK